MNCQSRYIACETEDGEKIRLEVMTAGNPSTHVMFDEDLKHFEFEDQRGEIVRLKNTGTLMVVGNIRPVYLAEDEGAEG